MPVPDILIESAWRRMQDARAQLTALRRQLDEALQSARQFSDKNLSPEGLSAKRHELAGQVRAKFGPQIEQLRSQISDDHDTLTSAAQERRPKLADDPGALMRAQVRWDQTRMKLEAGMSLRQVIDSSTDVEELLAIREWAPTWLTVETRKADRSHGDGFSPPDPSAFMAAIDAKLGEVAAESSFGPALSQEAEASKVLAYTTSLLDHMDAKLANPNRPSDDLYAVVAAGYAEEEATGRVALANLEAHDSASAEAS